MKQRATMALMALAIGLAGARTGLAQLTNRYVVKANAAAAAPYDTWANAAGDIQTAINYTYTAPGSTVIVAAATYDTGGTLVFLCTNRVYISKAITVQSQDNDPTRTIIRGAWASNGQTNGPDAVRCVYMAAGARLIGFMLTNGATAIDGTDDSTCGGGVYTPSASSVISNCIIAGNAAYGNSSGTGGGGACRSATFFNCHFLGNWVLKYGGGGAFGCILSNCTLVGNSTPANGGGALNGALYGCVISNNVAGGYGGGVSGWSDATQVRVVNSLIISNRAARGGGTYGGVLDQCRIIGNAATLAGSAFGGGAYSDNFVCLLNNCQIISNRAPDGGGGVYRSFTTNCVIAYNTAYGALRSRSLVNCLVYGNDNGVVIDVTWYPLWIVESCTIVGNAGTGLYVADGVVPSLNNIIYGNANNWLRTGGTLSFTNTCTTPEQAGWAASNITNDPSFLANGSGYGLAHVPGNYRVTANSPCVNRGTNQSWMTNALDLDGRPRIRYGTADMGVYETLYRGAIFKFR